MHRSMIYVTVQRVQLSVSQVALNNNLHNTTGTPGESMMSSAYMIQKQ